MPHFPWGEEPDQPQRIDDQYQHLTIDVSRFCHDTHIWHFELIRQHNGDCVLNPKQKMGKEGYISNFNWLGASYTSKANYAIAEDTHYRRIQTYEAVLPGYYIWWAIDKRDNPVTPPDIDVSDLFKNQPTSRYGSKRISITSLHLLQSYQDGFVNKSGHYPRLQFRNGGTLRYKREICYVVIVCAEGHFTGTDDDYPVIEYATNHVIPIPANIQDNGDNGRITSVGEWRVPITNGITRAQGVSYSWDQYVFAFHYPTSEGRMCLPSGIVQVHENIEHDLCFKKIGRVCPDKLRIRNVAD